MSNSVNSVIATRSLVKLHFSLALSAGEVIDSNFEKEPASFRIGDGSMLPGFESELLGLSSGDQIEKTIASINAFGKVNPENVQSFPTEKFKTLLEDDFIPAEPGCVVSFKDPTGFEIPGVVKELSEKEVIVDFNHPLAGKDIVFKAKIVSVVSSDTDAIQVKV